ncbi:MAG: hypothetical protein WC319_12530, partial [Candidatus Paceibacterota bacterium]
MLDNFARSVQILITLSGNVESQLTNISSQVDKLSGRKISIDTGPVNQLAGAATNAATSITSISDKTKNAERNVVGSFGAIKSSVDEVNAGVGNLISSLAGIAIGGSISGLAWLQSAEAKLYNEQIERAITNNKKLGFSYDDLKKKVEEQVEAGEGTRQDTEKEFYAIIMSANKYIGKGPKALDAADAISDFYFRQQEAMDAQGIGSPEQMIMRLTQTEGKISDKVIQRYALAMGIDPNDKRLRSAKSRVKYIIEQGTPEEEGGFTNMKKELEKRPWEQAKVALDRLKTDIGDSLAVPLANLTSLFAGLVDTIRKIPGGSALIGWSAMLLTAVSVLGLLNSVLTPGIKLLQEMVLLTNASTIAKSREILVSKALIVTDWLGLTSKSARTGAIVAETIATAAAASATALNTGAIGMESVALEIDAVANLNTTGAIFGTTAARTAAIGPTMGLTGATTSLAAAEWAALSPLLLLAIPLIAIAGLLYLVETRTHVFSNALDKLSKTEMSKDLIQWLEDVGYWAGYAVDRLGSVIESDLFSKIENLNSAYTNVKSGNFAGQMLGSVSGMPGTNLLTMTKIVTPLSLMQNHLEFIVNVLSWFKNFFSGGNPLTNIYNAIIRLPANIYKSVSEWVSKQIEKVTTKFSEITKFFGDINTGLSTKFGEITSDISTKYNEITTSVSNWFSEITSGITTKFNELLTSASTKFGEITSGVTTKYNEISSIVSTKFSDIIASVSTTFGEIITNVTTKFDEIRTSVSTKFEEIITTITTKITDIISTITTKFEGITTTITTKFNDIITSIKSMLPSWAGGNNGEEQTPSFEGFKEYVQTATKGSENYKMYTKTSDEVLNAAYTEAQTGIPQEHPYIDEYEYKLLVSGYEKYLKSLASASTTPKIPLIGNLPTDNLSPHETEINRHEGNIDYEISKEKGVTAGYILPEGSKNTDPQIDLASIASENENKKDQGLVNKALNMIGFADGGFVQKTGFALVHEGEPIIPADVASSSRLQNILEGIAYGGSSSNTYGDINVRINYTPPSSSTSSNMIV